MPSGAISERFRDEGKLDLHLIRWERSIVGESSLNHQIFVECLCIQGSVQSFEISLVNMIDTVADLRELMF